MNAARFEELKVRAAAGRSPDPEDWDELTPAEIDELNDIHREIGGFILDDEKDRTSLRYKKPD